MSRFTEIQNAVAATLRAHPGIPAKVDVIARRGKEVGNNIDAALGKQGICIYVMAPLPRRATETETPIVFFESADIRVRIIEQTVLNSSEFDAWEALEQVMLALQGTNPNNLFASPLGLSATPFDNDEQDVEDDDGKRKLTRIFDVIFDGAFQLNP